MAHGSFVLWDCQGVDSLDPSKPSANTLKKLNLTSIKIIVNGRNMDLLMEKYG